jgi:transcriptional regulator with XRE-family HTH domain
MSSRTIYEVAEAVGKSPSLVYRVKEGKRLPSIELLHALCDVYALDKGAALDAAASGPAQWSAYVKARVFDPSPAEDPV